MLRTLASPALVVLLLSVVAACGDDDRPASFDGSMGDGGAGDSATPMDAGGDAGPVVMDDAGESDAGPTTDAEASDAGDDDGGAAGCDDGVTNGDETDEDCGGTSCEARCEDGDACRVGADCVSRVCIGEVCIAPSCSDGIRNGDETDRDCGGSECDGCALGRMCAGMDDCADTSAMCTGGFCQPGSCADGVLNNAETDVDCGGGTCAPCSDGESCVLARDCATSICMGGVCLPASCTNDTMDAGEVGVDCGGPCAGCPDGTACTAAEDCASDRCEGDVCTSCDDGVMNGAETDVDCGGGACAGCPAGSMCSADTDCLFGACLSTGCNGPSEYYRETFEGSDGGWTTGGTSSSWAYGEPMGDEIAAAYGGTGAWVTNLSGDYNSNEMSWVQSPAIDLSAASDDPVLEFALNHETESCCDEGWVEVSTDGTTWTKLGTEGAFWYNDSSDEWTGLSGGWRLVRHVLTGMAGEATVYVRVVLSSDGSVQREGFGVDTVVVRDSIPVNLQVTAEPVADICGGIVVSATNVGDETVSSFTLEYGIGSTGSTETVTDLAPGDSATRVVFGSDGDVVYGEAVVTGDLDLTDNAAMATVAVSTVAIDGSTDYAEDFDSDDGGWLVGGTNASWEHGAPSDTIISSADSGTSAWVTNLTGDYNSDETSYLVSPCIDASGAPADLQVSFAHLYATESCCDEGWMEYSVDGGRNWLKVVHVRRGMGRDLLRQRRHLEQARQLRRGHQLVQRQQQRVVGRRLGHRLAYGVGPHPRQRPQAPGPLPFRAEHGRQRHRRGLRRGHFQRARLRRRRLGGRSSADGELRHGGGGRLQRGHRLGERLCVDDGDRRSRSPPYHRGPTRPRWRGSVHPDRHRVRVRDRGSLG